MMYTVEVVLCVKLENVAFLEALPTRRLTLAILVRRGKKAKAHIIYRLAVMKNLPLDQLISTDITYP